MRKGGSDTRGPSQEERIRRGWGHGAGPDYQPWRQVPVDPSTGVASTLPDHSGQIHHVFSRLECDVLLVLMHDKRVEQVREKFCLAREETQAIALSMGIRHPDVVGKSEPAYLTSDFVVTVRGRAQHMVREVVLEKELQRPRVRELLALRQGFWAARHADWGVYTERSVSRTLATNLAWLHPYCDASLVPVETDVRAELGRVLLHHLQREPRRPFAQVARECDGALGLSPGTALALGRHLIASGAWDVDLRRPLKPGQPLVFQASVADTTPQVANAS